MNRKKKLKAELRDLVTYAILAHKNVLKKNGILKVTMEEAHTIEAIGLEQGQTMTQVAKRLGVSPSKISLSVSRLEKKGYVIRERQDDDRRLVKVSLTKDGEEIQDLYKDFHKDFMDVLTLGMDEERLENLLETVQRTKEFFQEAEQL